MDNATLTTWCFISEKPISDRLFNMARDMRFSLARKHILFDKFRAFNPTDGKNKDLIRMPDDDIALLSKSREGSCCRVCGDFIEIYSTSSAWIEGEGDTKTGGITTVSREDEEKKRRNSIVRSAKRAEKTVRRLVNTNRLTTMWTLTFAPDSEENRKKWRVSTKEEQSNIEWVKAEWREFYLKINKYKPRWKWLVVFELHDSTKTSEIKRGTWHIHFATDTRLEWEAVNVLWERGNVRFDDFSKPKRGARKGAVRNPGAYMSKYIGKSFDESNFHVKRYSRSRNMKRPEKITVDTLLERFPGLRNLEKVFHTENVFEYDGIRYFNHNITYKISASL